MHDAAAADLARRQGRAVLADEVADRLLGLAGDLAHLLQRQQHRRGELADEQLRGRAGWVHPGLRLSIPAAARAGSVLDDADLYRRLRGGTRLYQIFRMSGFLLTSAKAGDEWRPTPTRRFRHTPPPARHAAEAPRATP